MFNNNSNKIFMMLTAFWVTFSLGKSFADVDLKKIEKSNIDLRPSFAYTGKESIDEMRKKCIDIMAESIKVQWSPKVDFSYRKSSGAASKKDANFAKSILYAGIPYTSAASGLYQWLYFYDYKTGIFNYDNWETLEKNLGNSCAANVIWAAAAVSKSVSCKVSWTTYSMTPVNGWLPVGNYFYPENIVAYDKNWDTTKIIASNSSKVMFESYSLLKKADAIVAATPLSGTGNAKHAVMVVDEPKIFFNKDKSINGEKSFVIIQDQAFSNYKVNSNNKAVLFHGHLNKKYTFDTLLKTGFIPLTIAEFKGTVPFEKSFCRFVCSGNIVEDWSKSILKSNYRIAIVECVFKKTNGNYVDKSYYLTKGKDVDIGQTTSFKLKNIFNKELINKLKSYADNRLLFDISVTLCNGETYSLSDLEINLK